MTNEVTVTMSEAKKFGIIRETLSGRMSVGIVASNSLVGLFREQEDRDGCFLLLKTLFKKYGLHQSMYLERASQFKTTQYEGLHSLQIREEQTQFQLAMNELSVYLIFSNTPQARGHIERMNGTFQDRLVAELDQHSITNISDANDYLRRKFILRQI